MKRKRKKSKKECAAVYAAVFLSVFCLVFICISGCGRTGSGTGETDETSGGQESQAEGIAQENVQSGVSGNRERNKDDRKSGNGTESPGNSAEKNASGNPGSTDVKNSSTAAVKEVCHVGDTLQDGNLRIIYMASGEYHEESEYQQPEAGHKYIFLQFAFQNTDVKYDCPISLFSFNCYADSYAAQAWYGGEKELAASLSAGRSTVGNIYFSVPEDAREIEVEYKPDHLSLDKIRFVYEGEKDAGFSLPPDTERTEGAFRVSDSAVSDLQRISYLSCEKDDSDNEFLRPADGCTFYTLTFEFENLQNEDRQVSVHDFSCYADGTSCERSLFRDDYISATVAGGRKTKGTVTFEVPDDAQTVEVEYETGRYSDSHVVFTVR